MQSIRRICTTHTLSILVLALVAGCSVPVSTTARPAEYYDAVDGEDSVSSLFAGDAAVLSDTAIREILQHEYQPPALSRVALLPFGRESWSRWSEELAIASDEMHRRVLGELRDSPRIYDASFLPSMLIPEHRTVPHLREAAARYQADLLVVYRSYCRTFERYRLFAADRIRAYCGVEAVLMDVRTGLVPFTSVATRTYDVNRNRQDASFQETRMRAQINATATAMSDVSSEIVSFLAPGP